MSRTDVPNPPISPWTAWRYRAEAAIARTVWTGIRTLPLRWAYGLADALSRLVVLHTRWHDRRIRHKRRGVERNMRIVFRDALTPERADRLLRGWARHTTRLVVDLARLSHIDARNLQRYADVSEIDRIRPIVKEGRGLICVTAHVGVWELCGHLASLSGLPVTVVSRPAANPRLEALVTRIRTSGGQKVLPKWGVIWSLKKALDRGEVLGLVADENTRKNAVFTPFLGTLAATTPTPAALHRRTGVPMAVVACYRVAPGRFQLRVWDVIRHVPTDDRQADLEAITQRMNDALSRAILHAPDQWFWGLRRFSTRPPGERPGPDGLPPRAHGLDRYAAASPAAVGPEPA